MGLDRRASLGAAASLAAVPAWAQGTTARQRTISAMMTDEPAHLNYPLFNTRIMQEICGNIQESLLLFDWQQQRVTRCVDVQPAMALTAEPLSVLSLAASPCGRLLAAGTSAGACVLCQHAAAELVWLSSGTAAAPAVGFCRGGRRLLAARGAAVEVWDTAALMQRARLLLPSG